MGVSAAVRAADLQTFGEPVAAARQNTDGEVVQNTTSGLLVHWKQFDRTCLFSDLKGAGL